MYSYITNYPLIFDVNMIFFLLLLRIVHLIVQFQSTFENKIKNNFK